ncbi:carboxypeptidase-like regulatory domain-containing protein [Alistipes sp. CAG:268]|jgi:TonB-dependent SusC/RagA subfamily outer membrane receptor|uniref:carboxypeptidase-like regulatory domain-containing protein n=1 Tax=Alistipes sp. CAG:268 TaxID=1262693 RepID=UPI00033A9B85|nr:carboxypeptidase-like regulatory domain-containing protein [Alistipes sp. CAG:268]CDC96426.1 tonB-dependent receptor plug [Alistipes sp. CAG:268]
MKKLYLAWLICLMAFQVSAQQRWVTGVVADTNGVPVVGATVTVKGGTNGAITNSDGSFRIEASDSDILVFKYLGYDEQEIQVGPRTRIEIELRESAHQLDDVVVTGYQTISKERATGSFDIIDKAQLEKPSGSIASRLIGSAAGLVGTQDAYGNPVFEIRGRSSLSTSATEPLLVVDGFAIEGGFESINPNDVESVTVLKDAAAASIWGAKSANGVIVVTTKNARSEGGGESLGNG